MITEVHVKNFRGIGDETVFLNRLSVLVGPNGAGKSSFVDAIRFVRDAVSLGPDDAVLRRHGIAALRRWSPRRPYDLEIVLKFSLSGLHGCYGFSLASVGEGNFRIKHELCGIGRTAESIDTRFERQDDRLVDLPQKQERHFRNRELDPTTLVLPTAALLSMECAKLRRFFREMEFFTIFPNTLREPQKPFSSLTSLGDHGENFATVLRALLKRGTYSDELTSALGRVVPGIKGIRVSGVGGYLVTELEHAFGEGKSAWFDLSQESDGTLRLLGLLVALYYSRSTGHLHRFLALEEPELTLHPGALGVISDELLQASKRSQLLVTTQSPDLISRFDASHLRVVERVDGVTHIGPIDESQREAVEAKLFTAGDLLRIEGLRREPL
ncbi:MAG: AAA family ATPase [Acidobacteriaceae bacterium]|nr:AAA family ATPase [Acidobacteriaceae bacterium]